MLLIVISISVVLNNSYKGLEPGGGGYRGERNRLCKNQFMHLNSSLPGSKSLRFGVVKEKADNKVMQLIREPYRLKKKKKNYDVCIH